MFATSASGNSTLLGNTHKGSDDTNRTRLFAAFASHMVENPQNVPMRYAFAS